MSTGNKTEQSNESVKPVSMNLEDKLKTLNAELTAITGTNGVMDSASKGQFANILKRLTDTEVRRGRIPDIKIVKGGVTVTISELIKANMDVKMSDTDEKEVKDIKKKITAISTLMG